MATVSTPSRQTRSVERRVVSTSTSGPTLLHTRDPVNLHCTDKGEFVLSGAPLFFCRTDEPRSRKWVRIRRSAPDRTTRASSRRSSAFFWAKCFSAFRTPDSGATDAPNLSWLNLVATLDAASNDRGSHFGEVDLPTLRHRGFIIAHSRSVEFLA